MDDGNFGAYGRWRNQRDLKLAISLPMSLRFDPRSALVKSAQVEGACLSEERRWSG